jgi:hypothetical protein
VNVWLETIELLGRVGIAGHVMKCLKKTAQVAMAAGIRTSSIIEFVARDGLVENWASR